MLLVDALIKGLAISLKRTETPDGVVCVQVMMAFSSSEPTKPTEVNVGWAPPIPYLPPTSPRPPSTRARNDRPNYPNIINPPAGDGRCREEGRAEGAVHGCGEAAEDALLHPRPLHRHAPLLARPRPLRLSAISPLPAKRRNNTLDALCRRWRGRTGGPVDVCRLPREGD